MIIHGFCHRLGASARVRRTTRSKSISRQRTDRFLTSRFTVATIKGAYRVQSGQRRVEPGKARRLACPGCELDWEAALVWVDDRFECGELRMIALAPKDETLYYVAFVDVERGRRIISLRRANRREVK